jgi:hypothetical protein
MFGVTLSLLELLSQLTIYQTKAKLLGAWFSALSNQNINNQILVRED